MNGSPTQTMISGAIATIGVTCSTIAQGRIAARAQRLLAISAAIATATTQLAISAANVTARVDSSDCNSSAGASRNACTIASGPGRM